MPKFTVSPSRIARYYFHECDRHLRYARALELLRKTILEIVPEAEQCIGYGMPAFKLDGKVVAGLAAFKNHLSYFPHSGSVLPEISHDLTQYSASKGTLQFPVDQPLQKALVKKLVAVRRRQIGSSGQERNT